MVSSSISYYFFAQCFSFSGIKSNKYLFSIGLAIIWWSLINQITWIPCLKCIWWWLCFCLGLHNGRHLLGIFHWQVKGIQFKRIIFHWRHFWLHAQHFVSYGCLKKDFSDFSFELRENYSAPAIYWFLFLFALPFLLYLCFQVQQQTYFKLRYVSCILQNRDKVIFTASEE